MLLTTQWYNDNIKKNFEDNFDIINSYLRDNYNFDKFDNK